jgi:hypothetical protein
VTSPEPAENKSALLLIASSDRSKLSNNVSRDCRRQPWVDAISVNSGGSSIISIDRSSARLTEKPEVALANSAMNSI